ncbi:MAG: NAD(P)-dependent alcohol dehydrogenase [Bdellovibrionales bacterium]|nr:NAD(P)-dependent alcohol dehydrogenase [Bdellovibrionales bacterium]
MDTKAYANHGPDKPFVPYSFVRRAPGPKDVAISITYCGICHSDIHTARSEWGDAFYPCVPGHEIIGTVQSVGNEVTKFSVGQTVGVGCLVDSCRTCSSCKEGLEQYCENEKVPTYNAALPNGDYTKGGYSNFIVVDEDFVLRIPENLDPAAAAPLLCAGITTYSPLRHVGVQKGHKVAILGLGGLGHMGVKLANSFGAEVTVLSRSPHKQADAERLGASKFLLTTDEEAVAKHAGYFDFILDTVSAPHDLGQALGMMKREGKLILVGASERPLELEPFPLILARRCIMGSLIGGLPETQEMLDHCGDHNITSDIELIEPSYINEAYERVLKSDIKYRFVIDCTKL